MKRTFALFLALLAVLSLGVSMVSADTVGFSGTIEPTNSSQMTHITVNGDNTCGTDVGFDVFYHARTLSVSADGTYTFTLQGDRAGIYLYNGAFNPTEPTTNCIAAMVNLVQQTMSVPLVAGTTYTLIVWDDDAPSTTNYSGSVAGDGTVTVTPTQIVDEPTDPTPEPTQEVTPEPTQEVTPEPTSEVTSEPTSEVTSEPTSEVTSEPTSEVSPTGTPAPVVPTQQPCLYPFPTGASIYFVPQGAPTFYQPKLETQNSFNLPAGTWYMTELDDEDDFAKVWIACRAAPVYIPLNAIDLPVVEDAD